MAEATIFHTFENPRYQNLPFPSDIVNYMIQTPSSSKGVQKLYQTCKYFFSINKILVLKDGRFGCYAWPTLLRIREKRFEECKFIAKFWFIHELHILDPVFFRLVPLINSHTYLCKITYLQICDQIILEDEFDMLIKDSRLSRVSLAGCSIFKDTNILSFVEVLDKLPYLRRFDYTSDDQHQKEAITTETLKNLNNLTFHRKFNEFELENIQISSTIDINPLFIFIKKVAASRCFFNFALHFENAAHRKRIQKAANKMLKNWGKKNVDVDFHIFRP